MGIFDDFWLEIWDKFALIYDLCIFYPIMLGFGFVECLLQISIIRAKVMGGKYDLESSQVKRVAKQAQQAQSRKIQGTFCGPNEAQNASFEKCRGRAKQRAPRMARGVHHGPW